MNRFLAGRQGWIYFACLVLLIPAFFINLGKMPLFGDEPIRGLVALEMIFSDNWVAPTINGELYLKKPPFYNWLVAGTIQLFGVASEWVIRLPAIVPLLLYALTIYLVFKPYTGFKIAFLSAFFFLTCGRILIYASLLGHIDFFYAWLTFGSFMWIFYMYERKQWLALFLGSYILAAIGFLCKGMPSVVFQGLTLIAWFTYQGQFKRLFYWQHFIGGLGFLVLIGIYAFFYQQTGSLEALISTLWSQSTKRTILEQPVLSTIFHLLSYPFQMLYHILPWSLLVVFLFRRDWWQKIRQNRLLTFSLVTLAANIWVYWISPATLPRYIFMLYPFLFLSFAYFYQLSIQEGRFQKVHVVLEGLLGVAAVGIAITFWIPVLYPQLVHTTGILWKVVLLFAWMLVLLGMLWKLRQQRLVLIILVLLTMRITFSTFILPTRAVNSKYPLLRESAHQVARITSNQPLHLLKPTRLAREQSFYITRERESVLDKVAPDTLQNPKGYYIGSDSALRNLDYKQRCYFRTKLNNQKLYLVKISEPFHQ
jgi:4-amino-4-deoxy-L-arabinose transferase-like glycosyltransferase